MNFKSLFSFLLPLFIFSCTPSPEKQAQKLLEKSIEAHQLSKRWEDVSAIKFKKRTRLLDENGAIENESEQWVEFRLKPYFEAKLTWTKDSVLHVASFNGSKMNYQMGANAIQNEGFLKSKRAEIDAAHFAFAQPWILSDEDYILTYEGQKALPDGKSVEAILLKQGADSVDEWVYLDPNTTRVVALVVNSKGNKSLIENTSYDESTGLLLAKKQQVFKLDETGKPQFLQAEYLYSGFEVTFE